MANQVKLKPRASTRGKIIGIIFLLVQGVSELFKSYWAAKKGQWPGESK